MKISQLRKRSNDFVRNLDRIISDVVDFNEDLEQLNRDQLWQSKLSDGSPIKPSNYSPTYADWKRRVYPQSWNGKVNLKATGNLYDSIVIRYAQGQYEINSPTAYTTHLIARYGEKIFDISPENQPKARAITTKLISNQYKQKVL